MINGVKYLIPSPQPLAGISRGASKDEGDKNSLKELQVVEHNNFCTISLLKRDQGPYGKENI